MCARRSRCSATSEPSSVISVPDVRHIYELPVAAQRGRGRAHLMSARHLGGAGEPGSVADLVHRIHAPSTRVRVGDRGQVHPPQRHLQVAERGAAHGGVANPARVELNHVDSETLDLNDPGARSRMSDAILVPGGFGSRASRARSPPFVTRAATTSRSSASAWGCSSRWSSTPQRARPRRRQLARVLKRSCRPRHRADGRAASGDGERRHDAPRRDAPASWSRQPRPRLRRRRRSRSATATATR
jgi:hypothetical protein